MSKTIKAVLIFASLSMFSASAENVQIHSESYSESNVSAQPLSTGYWTDWYAFWLKSSTKVIDGRPYACQAVQQKRDYMKLNPTNGEYYVQTSEKRYLPEECFPI